MKKKTGIIIIILSGLSILGVVITQIFWMENAYKLKSEQFSDKVQVSLKTVVNGLYSLKSNRMKSREILEPSCGSVVSDQEVSADLLILDSLLRHELHCVRISKDYVYAIYQERKDRNILVAGEAKNYEEEIFNSPYKASLSCLYNHRNPYYISVYFLNEDSIILRQLISGFLISAIFVLIIGFSFIYIIVVTFRQKRISLMKNDFVNNMTHEFKTPISTVSLSSEMLLRDDILDNKDRAKKYARVIFEENQRLKHQVEQVLQIAVIDRGEYKIHKKEVDVHKIVAGLVHKTELTAIHRGGAIKTYLDAKYPKIWADKMHFTNMISNLLDNACKYSLDSPVVTVRTRNNKNGIIVSIEDNGMGIKSENKKDIFKQFYRVHTGNLHDVKGFGLGLYYVKLMADAHGGSVKLSSEWGKGSVFEIFFPFNNEIN
jgi:two-component system phosphate regulon sensor histidine kinase PhoR